MEMLWIPLISQIGRNHQNMWKKSVFLKVLDNVWTCFEITSWQKSSKKTKKRRKLWKKRVFSPLLFRPGSSCKLKFQVLALVAHISNQVELPLEVSQLQAEKVYVFGEGHELFPKRHISDIYIFLHIYIFFSTYILHIYIYIYIYIDTSFSQSSHSSTHIYILRETSCANIMHCKGQQIH